MQRFVLSLTTFMCALILSRRAIDLAAIPYLDHLDDDVHVVDRINNAIHPLPDSIQFATY